MNLKDLQQNWDQFGKDDPYWAIITKPGTKGNKWDESEFFRTGVGRVQKIVKKIQRLLPGFSFSSALDFGCGAGRITQSLADEFENATGVDIAPSMIALANEKNKKTNCNYVLNERNDLSLFKNDSFDLVFSVITLQHMQPNYAKNYIAEFLRVLKKGGMIIFQIPSRPDDGTRMYHRVPNKLRYLLIKLLRRTRSKAAEPVMEMYWIEIGEMITFITENKGTLMQVEKDDAAGADWDSYTYYVTKN